MNEQQLNSGRSIIYIYDLPDLGFEAPFTLFFLTSFRSWIKPNTSSFSMILFLDRVTSSLSMIRVKGSGERKRNWGLFDLHSQELTHSVFELFVQFRELFFFFRSPLHLDLLRSSHFSFFVICEKIQLLHFLQKGTSTASVVDEVFQYPINDIWKVTIWGKNYWIDLDEIEDI